LCSTSGSKEEEDEQPVDTLAEEKGEREQREEREERERRNDKEDGKVNWNKELADEVGREKEGIPSEQVRSHKRRELVKQGTDIRMGSERLKELQKHIRELSGGDNLYYEPCTPLQEGGYSAVLLFELSTMSVFMVSFFVLVARKRRLADLHQRKIRNMISV
tara:strand:- start:108 stop:593 length:486 start_codon:yes stop_codon:yes gene_type:complete